MNVTVPPLEYVYSATQINVASPTITLTYPAVTANVGENLSVSPTVTGLTGAAVYSIVSGSLPQGLSLNPTTGVISGVPTDTPGSFPVVIEVTGPYGSQRTSLVIELKSPTSTVTVEKVTITPSADNFGFGGDFGAFNLVAGNVKDFTNVTPGTYTISEDDPAPAGYTLTDITCVDSATGQSFPGDLTSRSVALDLVAGERVHCTFTNTKLAPVSKDMYFPIMGKSN